MWLRRVATLVCGLVFGAAATWLNVPPRDYILDASARRVASLVVNSGALWAGTAVLGGWLMGSVRRGFLGGPLALVPAVVVYYLLGAVVGSENADGSPDLVVFFSLVALITGPALGAVGGLIRRRSSLGLVAALVPPPGVGLELAWRSATAELQPDPARRTADLILIALALAAAAAAVIRHVAGLGEVPTQGRTRGSGTGPR